MAAGREIDAKVNDSSARIILISYLSAYSSPCIGKTSLHPAVNLWDSIYHMISHQLCPLLFRLLSHFACVISTRFILSVVDPDNTIGISP